MFKSITFNSSPTPDGYRVTAVAEVDPKLLEGVRRWAEREAEANRLVAITGISRVSATDDGMQVEAIALSDFYRHDHPELPPGFIWSPWRA